MPAVVDFTHAATTFSGGSSVAQLPIEGEVDFITIDDWPANIPQSGAQDPNTRRDRNKFAIKNIKNAFAGKHGFKFPADGVIDELCDSEAWTHQGVITHARLHQTLSDDGEDGSSVWAPSFRVGDTDATASTEACMNPHMPVFFEGDRVAGVFMGRTNVVAANDYNVDLMVLASGSWSETENLVDASNSERAGIADMEVHKDSIFVLYGPGGGSAVESSSNGHDFSATADTPAQWVTSGSRLLSDGNLLHVFSNQSDKTINIEDTSDSGATFTARLTGAPGQLRDVGFFFDRDNNSRVVVLTHDRLYWYDTTNYVLNQLLLLPFAARAMDEFGGRLIIFMDNGRVFAYSADGAFIDVSPGGVEGMPDTKDIGVHPDGQVCLTRTTTGIYALWSSDSTSGTDLAPFILIYRGIDFSDPNNPKGKWHFIWQDTSTRDEAAARFITFFEGDLFWGVAGSSNVTALYQMKDVEIPYDLLGTAVEFQEDSYIETCRIDFDSPSLSATMLDGFFNTDDVDSTATIVVTFGVDGAAATASTLGTVDSDDETHTFPSASSDIGSNLRTIAIRLGFNRTAGAGSDALSPKLISAEFGYIRTPAVRFGYIVPVSTKVDIHGGRSAQAVRKDVRTILGLTTKGTLALGGDESEDTVTVLPIPRMRAKEIIGDTAGREKRVGVYPLLFEEV